MKNMAKTAATRAATKRNGFDFSFPADVSFLNLLRTKMAFSKDESNFALLAQAVGIRTAIFLASKSRWKLRKPLLGLLSEWNELGRNCTSKQIEKQRLSDVAKTEVNNNVSQIVSLSARQKRASRGRPNGATHE
jgi:hypothetical protein